MADIRYVWLVRIFCSIVNLILQIDGVDITQLGLHELRNQLTIIPQDPGNVFDGPIYLASFIFYYYLSSYLYFKYDCSPIIYFIYYYLFLFHTDPYNNWVLNLRQRTGHRQAIILLSSYSSHVLYASLVTYLLRNITCFQS